MDLISLIQCILFLNLIIPAIILVYHQYVLRQKLKNFPQFGVFLFGITLELIKRTDYEILKLFEQQFMLYFKEGLFINWVGLKPYINLCKPEFLQIILSSTINIDKGRNYRFFYSWIGKGLLTSTGKQWFHDRRLIGPTFHFSILNQFAIVISEKAEILTKCLEREMAKNPGKAINIFPFISNTALDVICETAMGVNVRAQEFKSKYTTILHRNTKLILERTYRPWYWPNWLYYLLPSGKEYDAGIKRLQKYTREIISERKFARHMQNSSAELENEFDIGKRQRKAFLDVLLDQNEKDEAPLTDDELREQVNTFMFAGHDTIAITTNWALFLLGNNLEQQEKVHEELEEVFKDSKTPASVQKLSQLKYLEMVIKETLRFYPTVPMVTRKLVEDVKLGDYTIPKDITIVLHIILIHTNPQLWPNPKKFDPDRFLPENSKYRHPYAYIPFSAGPRNCIGQRFALLEVKTILTTILRKWRVKSVKTTDEIQYGANIVLRPCEDIYINFTPKK